MEQHKVKYLKTTYCSNAMRGEVVCKEATGLLLQVDNTGSFIIKNDKTNTIDIIPKEHSIFISFL